MWEVLASEPMCAGQGVLRTPHFLSAIESNGTALASATARTRRDVPGAAFAVIHDDGAGGVGREPAEDGVPVATETARSAMSTTSIGADRIPRAICGNAAPTCSFGLLCMVFPHRDRGGISTTKSPLALRR
jgi:hypothetical protein